MDDDITDLVPSPKRLALNYFQEFLVLGGVGPSSNCVNTNI